jgi:peptidyl-prolyl cis-trans isomerase SurA
MHLLRARTFALASWFVVGLALAVSTAFAQTRELSSSGVLLDRIAAVVNDGVVLVSQLDEQTDEIIQRLRQQKTELPPRNVLRKQILERLIIEEVQIQRANRLGIEVSEEMLNGALEDVGKRNNIPFPTCRARSRSRASTIATTVTRSAAR